MAQRAGNHQPGSSKNHLEKVAIVGAGGNCGKFITEALLSTGKHVVTAITRAESKSQLPGGVHVKRVNYDDQSSLVEALRGQDALIVTMGPTAPPETEDNLARAAAEANVPWILPNCWSPDMANELLARDIVVGVARKRHHDLIETLGKSSWIAVSTGFWYEWSLAMSVGYGFDFANRTVTFFDDGETRINTSTWPQVGRAVAGLLSLKIHPDGENDQSPCLQRFRNQYVYVSSFTVSQKDMLESVLRVTHTKLEDWKVTKEPTQARYAAGMEQMKKGDREGFAKLLYTRVFYPDGSGNVEDTKGLINDQLDLPKEDVDEYTKIALQRAKQTGGKIGYSD